MFFINERFNYGSHLFKSSLHGLEETLIGVCIEELVSVGVNINGWS